MKKEKETTAEVLDTKRVKRKKLYKTPRYHKSEIEVNESIEGETLETKIERLIANSEDVEDGVGSVYTERKDGVLPAYDIRTDRMELALEALDKAHRWDLAKRNKGIEDRNQSEKTEDIVKDDGKKGGENENKTDSGAESTGEQ